MINNSPSRSLSQFFPPFFCYSLLLLLLLLAAITTTTVGQLEKQRSVQRVQCVGGCASFAETQCPTERNTCLCVWKMI